MRIVLMWTVWLSTSLNVNLANKDRGTRYAASLRDESVGSRELDGANQWLGWRQVATVLVTTALITLMSNAALTSDDNFYYAYYCLAASTVRCFCIHVELKYY